MNPNDIPQEIFDIIIQKGYTKLSPREKEIVDLYMNPEEYEEIKSILLTFKEVDDEIKVDPEELQIPMAQKQNSLLKIINYPIPAYQVAAGIALIMGLFILMNNPFKSDKTSRGDNKNLVQSGTPLSVEDYPEKLVFHP